MRVLQRSSPRLLLNDGQTAPYSSLTVRARKGRVTDHSRASVSWNKTVCSRLVQMAGSWCRVSSKRASDGDPTFLLCPDVRSHRYPDGQQPRESQCPSD